MSQSIRVGRGFVLILQHVPNTSSCMFVSTGPTEVGFPIVSMKECRKRECISAVSNSHLGLLCDAAMKSSNVDLDEDGTSNKGKYDNPLKVLLLGVSQAWSMMLSNGHPGLPFLPCDATMKSSNVDLDEDGTSNKGKYDNPLKVLLLGVSQAWSMMLSNIRSALRYRISKMRYRLSKGGALATMIYLDLRDPIDGLKVLLDVSQTWRMILSLSDDLYDGKGFHDYGESYHRKARPEGGTKNPPLKLTETRLTMLRILADLDDPFDGLKFLLGDFELWKQVISSDRMNDSEGYLQKEIFALRDLSTRARILVSNRNGKHDEAKNPPSQITHVLELLKFKMDNFEDPSDVLEAMRESFRFRDETPGPLVAADAKLEDDNDGYHYL